MPEGGGGLVGGHFGRWVRLDDEKLRVSVLALGIRMASRWNLMLLLSLATLLAS